MSERKIIDLTFQGMSKSGDSARQGPGQSRLLSDVVLRPGNAEALEIRRRGGFASDEWLEDQRYLFNAVTPSQEILFTAGQFDGGGGPGTSAFRKADNTWQYLGAMGITAHCVGSDGVVYGLAWADDGTVGGTRLNWKYDGTTFSQFPLVTKIVKGKMAAGIGRIFIGSPQIDIDNLLDTSAGQSWKYENVAHWGLSNATVAVASGVRKITFTAANGYAAQVTACIQGAEGWVTVQQDLRPSFTGDVPMTIAIVDAVTGADISTREVLVGKQGHDTDWFRIGQSVLIKAATQYRVELRAGTTSLTCPLNATVEIGYTSNETPGVMDIVSTAKGTLVTDGRYFFTESGICYGTSARPYEYLGNAITWCETDDYTWWRAENYAELTEAPGEITALIVLGKSLVVFKERGAWIFSFTDSPDLPLAFVDFIPEIGCVGTFTVAFGKIFFVDRDDLYEWDLSGAPKSIVKPEMRDYLFRTGTAATYQLIAVNTDDRELYVTLHSGKIHVLNLDNLEWVEWRTASSGGPISIEGMVYAQPRGTTERRLWVAYYNQVSKTNFIAYVSSGQGTDQIEDYYAFTSEAWLDTLQTPGERKSITVEWIDLWHRCSVLNTPITLQLSRDGGATWTVVGTYTLTAPDLAGDDAVVFTMPVHETGDRLMFQLKDIGNIAGPNSFRILRAQASVRIKGQAKRRAVGTT